MQYVIGEIFVGLGIAALAGLLVGWWLKGSMRPGTKSTASIPESIDTDATLDMTMALADKDVELEKLTLELHQLRGRDVTLQAGHSNQVQEINQLRDELTQAREALEANRTEFNQYRTSKKAELEQAAHQIAAFKAGDPNQDERIAEARETISALRVAVRENDRVIETLRARVREGDNTVEDLRNQLQTAERGSSSSKQLLVEREQQFANLKVQLEQTSEKLGLLETESESVKAARNQEVALNRSNERNLATVNARLQDAQAELAGKQKVIDALDKRIAEATARIDDLQSVNGKHEATEKALRKETQQRDLEISMLDGQLKTATEQLEKAKTELTDAAELRKMHKDKSAEVVAMHDMLSAAGKKRETLEVELGKMKRLAAEHAAALSKIAEHERANAKLRSDLQAATASRENLSTQLVEMQQAVSARESEHESKIQALKKAADERVNTESATLNQKTQRALVARNADLAKLQQEFNAVVAKRDDYEQQINTLQQRFLELDNDTQQRIEKIQRELDQAQRDARTKLQQANEKRAALEKRLAQLQSAVNSNENNAQELATSKQALADNATRIAKLEQLIAQADERARKQSATIDLRNRELASAKARAGQLASLERKLAHSRQTHQQETRAQSLFSARISDINEKRDRAEGALAQSSQRIEQLSNTVSQLQPLQQQVAKQGTELEQQKRALTDKESALKQMEAQLQQSVKQRQTHEQRIATLQKDLATQTALASKVAGLERSLAAAQKQTEQSSSAFTQQQQQAESTLQQLKAKLTEQTEQLKSAQAKVKEQTEQLNASEASVKEQAERLSASDAQLKEHSKRLAESDEKLRQQAEQLSASDAKLKEQATTLIASNKKLKEQATQFSSSNAKLNEHAMQLTAANEQLSSQAERLSSSEAKVKRLSNQLVEADKTRLALADSKSTILRLQSQLDKLTTDVDVQRELEQERARASQLAIDLEQRDKRLQDAAASKKQLDDTVRGYETRLAELEAELQQQRDLASSMGQQSEATLALNKKLADQSGEIESLREQLFEAQNAQSESRTDAALQAQNNAKLQRSLTARENELASLTARVNELQTSGAKPSDSPTDASGARIRELNQQMNGLKVQLAEKDHNINQLQNRIAQIQVDSAQSSGDAETSKKTQVKFDAMLAEAEQWRQRALVAERTAGQHDELQQSLQAADRQAADYQADLQRTREQLQQLQSKNNDLQQRLDNSARQSAQAAKPASTPAPADPRPVNPNRAKPRVFARQTDNFLRDSIGYSGHSVDGDDLTLLPGVDKRVQGLLNQAGITELQQIALWSKREISHYAEKVGLNPHNEDNHEWPTVARQILDGNYTGEKHNA